MGIFIDFKMSWINHINHVKSKVAKGIGILCKARKYLKQSTLLTLYYSFIYPYISHCLEVWGNANNTYIYAHYLSYRKEFALLILQILGHTVNVFAGN